MNAIIALVLSSSPFFVPPPMPRPDTLKGVDDFIRAGFEAYRGTCFNWLLAATGLVVVGLVFEGPELWHEITLIVCRWHFKRKFHFSIPEEHSPDWVKLLAFVGWLLIVIGVAGEYVADSFVSKADGYVQTFDEILLTEAQRRTAFASERASAAYERAAATERETAQENARAAKAEQHATEENARAAKALEAAEVARKNAESFQLQIAQANEQAAKAELETERLRKQMADRALSNDQCAALANAVRSFPEAFDVTAYWNSKESLAIANRIIGCLINAGWKYTPPQNQGMMFGGVIGVLVLSPTKDAYIHSEKIRKAAEALVSALNDNGINAEIRDNNQVDILHIEVGSKI